MGEAKKGVAERLREAYEGPGCTPMTIARTVGLEEPRCCERGCGVCLRRMLSALADMMDAEVAEAREASARDGMAVIAAAEGWPALRDGESVVKWVDRAWLPRPRYEGGEPVEVGGRAAGLAGRVGSYQVSDSGGWVLFGCDDYDIVMGSRDTPVAPLPEDTQEDIDAEASLPPTAYCAQRGINLGDDPDRETATAAMVRDLLLRQRELDAKGGVDAPLLTHAKPVFEANGERICVGDTVWFCGDDTGAYTVSAVEETLGGGWCLTVYNDAATIHEVRPSQVTHREPDSLEKLRASIKAVSTVACGASKGEVKEWADRLTALMERGA